MKRKDYFLITAPFVILVAVIAIVYPTILTQWVIDGANFFYTVFDWFLLPLPLCALTLCIYLAFSRYGKIRLGGKDAKPEYSSFSWMSMLFTAGIGVGIIFYGPLEALWHYQNSPLGIKGNFDQQQAAINAMSTSLFLWGVPAWTLYTLGGLIIAYFAYEHNGEFAPQSSIELAFKKKKWAKALSLFVIIMAIISIGLSITASIAMATGQVSNGLAILTGQNYDSFDFKIIILIILFIIYTATAILPISKGMKILSDYTMIVALILLLYIFLTGPTHYFISMIINVIGRIFTDTLSHSFELYIFKSRDFFVWYPLSYIVWWITWTPFVGVFLAKISKGRSIREFIICSILIPSAFMVVWFSVFSAYGLLDEIEGSKEIVAMANSSAYEGTIYRILEDFPLTKVLQIVTIFLFVSFVVTTMTSAAISLGIMTSKDGKSESKTKAIFWCVIVAMIAFAIIATGKIEGIKAMGSFTGFPFIFLLFIMSAALIRQLRKDKK